MTATQAPTPGPLSGDDVKLLVKGDWLLLDGQPVRFLNLFMGGIRADDGSNKRISALPPDRFAFIGRPGADGWMPWSGGKNPVPGQWVQVRQRGYQLDDESRWFADQQRWTDTGHAGDIIAFRLAPTAPVEASGSERDTSDAIDLVVRAKAALQGHIDAIQAGKQASEIGQPVGQPNPILDCINGLPEIVRWLDAGQFDIEAAFEDYEDRLDAALRPQPSGETR